MSLFPSLAAFFRRHKRKILFTSAASISVYLIVYQFIIKRFRNFQNSLRQEMYVKEQIKRRFIQTQTDCYLTILALMPVLTQPVMSHFPTESITAALKKKKNTHKEMSDSLTTENLMAHSVEGLPAETPEMQRLLSKSKLDLWQQLKVQSISRVLALIYSTSGLLLLTRLQLNILARKSYLDSAIAMAGASVSATSQTSYDYFIEQAYLSLSWWLLNHGWERFASSLQASVEAKFKDLTPKTELSVETFRGILQEITAEAIGAGSTLVAHSVFPVEYDSMIETLMNTNPECASELDNKDSNLVKLINETNFIFANAFTTEVFGQLVQSNIDTLCANMSMALNPEGVAGRTSKLATYLAQLSVQAGVLADPQNYGADSEITGNIYINNSNELEVLDEFSANIYSNFD